MLAARNTIFLRQYNTLSFLHRSGLANFMLRDFSSKNNGSMSSGYSSLESSIQKRESLRNLKVRMQTAEDWTHQSEGMPRPKWSESLNQAKNSGKSYGTGY